MSGDDGGHDDEYDRYDSGSCHDDRDNMLNTLLNKRIQTTFKLFHDNLTSTVSS